MRPVIWIVTSFCLLSAPLTTEWAIAQTDQETDAESDPQPAPSAEVDPVPAPAPQIRAKAYPLLSSRSSNSGRIYLFDDVDSTRPAPGKILLLRQDKSFVAGLRVLRTYLDRKQVAARVVKTYPEFPEIPIGTTFSTAEKVGSLNLPKLTAEEKRKEDLMDKQDLKEIESTFDAPINPKQTLTEKEDRLSPDPTIPDFDPELDAGTQQKPPSDFEAEDEEGVDPSQLENPLEIHEIEPLDDSKNMFSVSFGIIRSRTTGGGIAPFRTGALRYSRQVLSDIFQNSPTLQDDLSLEGSIFIYQVLNPTAGSAVTAMPVGATLRYTLNVRNDYGIFVYGGGTYSQAISSVKVSATGINQIRGPVAAFGVGVFVNVGPSWFARMDLGYDTLSVGLSLKF